MTNGRPIFEWIPGIPITDKDDKTQKRRQWDSVKTCRLGQ